MASTVDRVSVPQIGFGDVVKLGDLLRWPTDKDRFAQKVIRRAKERGWPYPITYDSNDFRLDVGVKDAKFFLHNIYAAWTKADPAERPGEIDRCVSAMFEANREIESLEEALPLLLPIIRNRRELECYSLNPSLGMESGKWTGAYQPLCETLAIGLAIDRPSSLALIDSRYLRQWEASFTNLLQCATMNLRERSPAKFQREPDGFYVSEYNDHYDCSRLLLPELFDLLSLNGDPVAIAVARQGMVVAGSRDTKALVAMARFAEEKIEGASRPVSMLPLVRQGRSWIRFEPTDPELETLRDLGAKQELWDYHEQRELLVPYCESKSRDVYVAKVEALKFDARVYGWTTWTQSLPTLLPRVDAVVINRGEGERPLMRAWADFWSVCGDTLADEQLYPVRYLTPPAIDARRLERLARDFGLPSWLPAPKDHEQLFV